MAATKASGLSLRSIRKYAERVGEHYGIYDAYGAADLDRLVRRLGGKVVVEGGPEHLVVKSEGNFVINIPLTTSERRDRFTIAHELGHYFLHYLYPELTGTQTFSRGHTNRAETEANTFASSLLMPAGKFTEAYNELGGSIRALAAQFDVSPRAAEVRCDVLGLPW